MCRRKNAYGSPRRSERSSLLFHRTTTKESGHNETLGRPHRSQLRSVPIFFVVFCADANLLGRFAGSDTTAIALRAIFYYLLKNPSCYAKLREELNQAESTNSFSESVTY